MKTENLVSIQTFCIHHNIEISFVRSLQEYGLIEIITIEETGFIDLDQLKNLEQFVRFHYDLEINLEGIETISHLLRRIDALEEESVALKNRLRFYEAG